MTIPLLLTSQAKLDQAITGLPLGVWAFKPTSQLKKKNLTVTVTDPFRLPRTCGVEAKTLSRPKHSHRSRTPILTNEEGNSISRSFP